MAQEPLLTHACDDATRANLSLGWANEHRTAHDTGRMQNTTELSRSFRRRTRQNFVLHDAVVPATRNLIRFSITAVLTNVWDLVDVHGLVSLEEPIFLLCCSARYIIACEVTSTMVEFLLMIVARRRSICGRVTTIRLCSL